MVEGYIYKCFVLGALSHDYNRKRLLEEAYPSASEHYSIRILYAYVYAADRNP